MVAHLYDHPLDQDLLKTKPVGDLILFDYKKVDGARIEMLDNVLYKKDTEDYLSAVQLRIIDQKDLIHQDGGVATYSRYTCC